MPVSITVPEPPEPPERPDPAWSSTVVLGDGETALIRPIVPSDADRLAAFHERQSAENRYRRYFSPRPRLDARTLERFTHVDMVDRAAFVVELHGEFIGWASYERWQQRDDAEVAFQVDDDHQGKGIATLLLEHLAALAVTNGITRFSAQTLGDNRAMLTVFSRAGWPVARRFESGVVDVEFPLAATAEFVDSVERREQRADSRAMARLLLPSSIAVIGASDRPGSIGAAVWAHVAADPVRATYPVNLRHDTVGGRPAYARIGDVPGEVGLAIVAVPAEQLAGVIDECIAKRVRGAVVIADPGPEAFAGLIERARRHGLRIIGPASMGVASPLPGVELQASIVRITLPPGGVAVSMQSGSLGAALLREAARLGLGLSWFVSLGDKLDVSANDLLQFWEDDEATRVICLYTESIGNGRKFTRIARRVSLQRPIVLVRTGAALVGAGTTAMYRQSGVIEVPTVADLLDTARLLAFRATLAGDAVGVVSNARSPRVQAEATLRAAGLHAAAVPVQLDWRASADDYHVALDAALADPAIHAVLVIHAPPTGHAVGAPVAVIDSVARAAAKPVVAVMLGAGDGPLTAGSPVPSFAFPEQAAAALGRVGFYSRWRRRELAESGSLVDLAVDAAAAGAILEAAVGPLDPHAVGAVLAAYGVVMPPTVQVPGPDAAPAADAIGYPVAVKAVRRGVGRSTEAGVALDLDDPTEVRTAVDRMTARLGPVDVLVQAMVPPGVDLRVHVVDDPALGPVVSVGLGGFQADLIGDAASRIAPITPAAARAMLADTRAAAALDAAGTSAVVDLVVRVAHLADDHPEIAEIDLNPVIVADGSARIVDAKLTRRTVPRPERAYRRLEPS